MATTEQALARSLSPGTILRERYKIVELVGRGGMGATYRAEDLRLTGRYCAVKEALPDLDTDPEELRQGREQFYQEASTLARLDHPNLPKVSDYFSENGRDYLVMDYVPGQDLREMLSVAMRDGHPLPERQVLAWTAQLCDALEYMHSQDPPILHRDIKPGNIKITPSGNVKLVDFGLVKVLAPNDQRTITVVQGRGTVQYIPLEQYGGDMGHTDARSDIYSLGATLYHLLTGQPPIDAKQRFLKPESLALPRNLNPSISPQTEQAILWCLSMHPNDRPESVTTLREQLFAPGIVRRTATRMLDQDWPVARFVRANRVALALLIILLLTATLITAEPGMLPAPPTPTPTATHTLTPSPTLTRTPRPTRTPTATATNTATPRPTRTLRPTATETQATVPATIETAQAVPTTAATPQAVPTATATLTPEIVPTATQPAP